MEVVVTANDAKVIFYPESRVMVMRFEGDLPDEVYKNFWKQAIEFGEANSINRVIIDQRKIGNVSFNARGWVVIHGFPRIKKSFPSSLAAGILKSDRVVQKTGMQYLLKAFQKMTGYKVEIFSSEEEAIAYLETANTVIEPSVA